MALGAFLSVFAFQLVKGTIDWVDVRVDLPTHLRLSQGQTALLAAAITASFGLIGNWAVKSRELRNARATEVASASLEFYERLRALYRFTDKITSAVDARGEAIEDISRRFDDLKSKAYGQRLLSGFNSEETVKLDEQVRALHQELQGLRPKNDIDPDQLWVLLEEKQLAFTRLTMYGEWQVHLFAREASIALDEYAGKVHDLAANTKARRALADFLLESRVTVTAMRSWWPRRWARAFWVTTRWVWRDAYRAIKVIVTERGASRSGGELGG